MIIRLKGRVDSIATHMLTHIHIHIDWLQRVVQIIAVEKFRECLILIFMCETKSVKGKKEDK